MVQVAKAKLTELERADRERNEEMNRMAQRCAEQQVCKIFQRNNIRMMK